MLALAVMEPQSVLAVSGNQEVQVQAVAVAVAVVPV
jgi:hypothetical protein